MRSLALVALFSAGAAGCASRNARFIAQERAEFRRQDSSFVNRAVDQLIQAFVPFRSLPVMSIRPKEIVVSRGDSAWVYQAVGTYVTYRFDRTPDACVPPSRASLVAWRDLPSRTGIDAVALFAAGDSAGMHDTFSTGAPECNGPMVTLHHPMLFAGRIIDRQYRAGTRPVGRGTIDISVGHRGARPCPSKVKTWFESQRSSAECRLTWMQVGITTRLRPTWESALSDTFIVNAVVPAVHIWLDCRGANKSNYLCPTLPHVYDTTARPVPDAPRRTPPQVVTVTGVVKDPVEGVPIPYARVRFENNLVVYADSTGRFTTRLKPGPATAMAECWSRASSAATTGQSQDPFVVRPYMAELVFFLQREQCKRPLGPVRDSVFVGIYQAGVEQSRFLMCGERTLHVWAEFAEQAVSDRDYLLPRLKGQEAPWAFLWTVRGSLTGPGRFGLQSTADYLLKIERVLDIRLRQSSECNR